MPVLGVTGLDLFKTDLESDLGLPFGRLLRPELERSKRCLGYFEILFLRNLARFSAAKQNGA